MYAIFSTFFFSFLHWMTAFTINKTRNNDDFAAKENHRLPCFAEASPSVWPFFLLPLPIQQNLAIKQANNIMTFNEVWSVKGIFKGRQFTSIHSLIHSFVHSFIHPFVYSFSHSKHTHTHTHTYIQISSFFFLPFHCCHFFMVFSFFIFSEVNIIKKKTQKNSCIKIATVAKNKKKEKKT